MKTFPSLAQAFILMIKLILWSLVMGIPLVVLQLSGYDHPDLNSLLTMLGYSFPFVLVINEAQKRIRSRSGIPHSFRFRPIPPYILFLLIPITAAMGLISEQIAYLVPGTDALEELMNDLMSPSVFTFFTVVVLAPLLEELLFRGLFMERFLRYMSSAKAIFWSALLFGVVHMIPAQAVSAFLAGLFIGWLYWRTRSLWACILVHLINNLLSYGMFVYYGDITTNEIIDRPTLLQVCTIAVLLLIFGIWIIQRRTTRPVNDTDNSANAI